MSATSAAIVLQTTARARRRGHHDADAIERLQVRALAKLRDLEVLAIVEGLGASGACKCGKPTAYDADGLTDGEHCACCLGDCAAPAVFLLDDNEHYCETCGPLEVVRLIALPGPSHISLVRLEAA